MKPVVALDLDELLFPFMKHLVAYVNAKNSTNWSANDFSEYDFKEMADGTRQGAVQLVNEFLASLSEHPEPVAGSVQSVARLQEKFQLVVVTARHDELEELTFAWLKEHFPDVFDGVYLCNLFVERSTMRAKADVCLELDAVALVDDSLDYVTKMAAAGRRGILFGDFPWNRTDALPRGVTRASNWDDVVSQLMELN